MTVSKHNHYSTNGTGRDTYIGFNHGGNTVATFASPCASSGAFGFSSATNLQKAPRSPEKTSHYNLNGTGRDTYIHSNHGGFVSNYRYVDDQKAYIKNLRNYETNHCITSADVGRSLKGNPRKDYFVEGQISIRSPKVRNGVHALANYQFRQSDRLAMPRKVSPNFNSSNGFLKQCGMRQTTHGSFKTASKIDFTSPTKLVPSVKPSLMMKHAHELTPQDLQNVFDQAQGYSTKSG